MQHIREHGGDDLPSSKEEGISMGWGLSGVRHWPVWTDHFYGDSMGAYGDFMGSSWGCRGIWCESDLNGSYEIQWVIAGYLSLNHGKSWEKKRNDIDFLPPNIQYPSCGPQNEWIQCSPLGFRLVSDVVRMRLYWYYWKSWGARLVKIKSPLPSNYHQISSENRHSLVSSRAACLELGTWHQGIKVSTAVKPKWGRSYLNNHSIDGTRWTKKFLLSERIVKLSYIAACWGQKNIEFPMISRLRSGAGADEEELDSD